MRQRFLAVCTDCSGRGKLWLAGADYLECPTCAGEGKIEVHEYNVQAKTRKVFIPGCQPHTEVMLPRSLVADIQIARKVS